MAKETIKAIQMSNLEYELLEIVEELRKWTNIYNSPKIPYGKFKQDALKKIARLTSKKIEIEDKITEGMLLE